MSNTYLEKIVSKIKILTKEQRFSAVAFRLRDLARYAIIMEDKFLVTISTELHDIFAGALTTYKEFKKDVKAEKGEELISSALELLECVRNRENKEQVLDRMVNATFLAEKLHYELLDLEISSRFVRKVRSDLL